jgi:hypothetical protein
MMAATGKVTLISMRPSNTCMGLGLSHRCLDPLFMPGVFFSDFFGNKGLTTVS